MLDEQGGKKTSLIITNEMFTFNKSWYNDSVFSKKKTNGTMILYSQQHEGFYYFQIAMLLLDLWYQNTCEWMNCVICSCFI